MNTRDLTYFEALYKLKNFSAVASAEQVSQPTISMAIARLEAHYGQPLFLRDQSHRVLTITPAGEQLHRHAARILQELAAATANLAALQTETLRLGLPPIIANFFFPSLVSRLANSPALTQLKPVEAGSSALLTQLAAGELDLALLGSIGPLQRPGLKVTEIARSGFVIVSAPARQLPGRLSFAQLTAAPFVALTESFVHEQALGALSTRFDQPLRIVFRSSDVQLLKTMVAQNVGIALLAQMGLQPTDPLATTTLTDADQPEFVISLVYRQHQVLTPLMQQFIAIATRTKKTATD